VAQRHAAGEAPSGSGPAGQQWARLRRLWQQAGSHAEALVPGKPWKAVAREFGTSEQQNLDAFRNKTLPPGMSEDAASRFR
jgi:hypothetical protein